MSYKLVVGCMMVDNDKLWNSCPYVDCWWSCAINNQMFSFVRSLQQFHWVDSTCDAANIS